METSSGWDSDEVQRWRRGRFDAWRTKGETFVHGAPLFHFLREDGAEERSPLMLRSWSSTRSVTQAAVDTRAGTLAFRYWGNPMPGSAPADAVHELDLLET